MPDPAPDRVDVAVVGGGILGLAVAREVLRRHPETRLIVLEREPELATHQSGHNSGVLHAGIYYPAGSLKARLCRAGKAALEVYVGEKGIPYERCGKVVVALVERELPRLAAVRERAIANEVPGLEEVGPEQLREIEPHAAGIRALWSPTTGIVDFRRVALALADDVRAAGGWIVTGREVVGIRERGGEAVITSRAGDAGGEAVLVADRVIACAGLWSDRLARAAGDRPRERIVPFRGDYYTLTEDARPLVRGLIYPVPDPRFPFLGVHFTRRIDGEVWAGPNAVLALSRTGYRRRDVAWRDLAEVLRYRGFLRLAARHWRSGAAELWRDLSKRAFHRELARYVPELRPDQLRFGPSGVRAQAVDPNGTLVDDFRFGGSGRVLHVRNAPSPAATASLAIAAHVVDTADQQFDR